MLPLGRIWPLLLVLSVPGVNFGANLPSCFDGPVKAFSPCETSFEWQDAEVPKGASAFKDELLNIEFKSPHFDAYLIRSFWDGGHTLKVRFIPLQSGSWTYRISSAIKRLDGKEGSFTAAEGASGEFVSVANLRHWWTTTKQPHLWLSATAPLLAMDQTAFESWIDARKHDGFTHIRGTLLTAKAANLGDRPVNLSYFQSLDDRIIAIEQSGLTADLILADQPFLKAGGFADWEHRDLLVRYLVSRYGSFNVAWQGIEGFEDVPESRTLLRELGSSLKKYDSYRHPRSTDARLTTTPLAADGWMDYLVEASPDPQLGAVDHQFTQKPTIHIVTSREPDAFRRELWNSTTNGEYICVPYEATQNEANLRAIQIWSRVMADTRHWELEPYFDVDNARAVGLTEVEYLAYTTNPGIVEITLPKHKYNPKWINPVTGEELPLKDYRGEVFSRQTPDASHDWILQVPREGHKKNMLKYVRFAEEDPPVQEIETDTVKVPFEIVEPRGDVIDTNHPVPFRIKITRANRASRTMEFVWYGEVVSSDSDGARVLALGSNGNFTFPKQLIKKTPATVSIRLESINANGKAYEVDRVYRLAP